MNIKFEEIKIDGYEKVVKVTEPTSGLLAIISIHSTALGPAIGGIRFRNYASFDHALEDVLRLSKGMTYKLAMTPHHWGGGKSVILIDPKKKSPELLRAIGRAIEQLEGKYIGAMNSGCTLEDLEIIGEETSYLAGINGSGNPAPFTAWGAFRGIEAAQFKRHRSQSLEGMVVAIQGVGNTGSALAEHLFWRGAHLIIADVNEEACRHVAYKFDATICDPQDILKVECDVLAPCAYGGIINSQIIPNLKCKILAGCANNQLKEDSDASLLAERGILYAPDFVINSGGVINCCSELEPGGYSALHARLYSDHIYEILLSIFNRAEKRGCSTLEAAYEIAEHRLKNTSKKKN